MRVRRVKFTGQPIHLLELLIDGHPEPWLDRAGSPPYNSGMKHSDENESGVATVTRTGAATGATVDMFLDAADVLYERIGAGLARVGLSYAKYEVLKMLADAHAPLTLGGLAEGAACARSNITQIVDRLEQDGLVRRVDDPDDRRSVRAELTEAGAALAEEGTTQLDLVRAQFAASFSTAERVELARLLTKIE